MLVSKALFSALKGETNEVKPRPSDKTDPAALSQSFDFISIALLEPRKETPAAIAGFPLSGPNSQGTTHGTPAAAAASIRRDWISLGVMVSRIMIRTS